MEVVIPAPLPADHRVAMLLLGIVIILIAARLVGGLAVKVKQPRVVGEIIAGILLGPSLLGRTVFAWDKPWNVLRCDASNFNFVAGKPGPAGSISSCLFPTDSRLGLVLLGTIALAVFMFLVGLELDFGSLKGKYRGIFTVAVGVVLIPVAAGYAIAPALYDSKFAASLDGVLAEKAGFTLMIAAMLAVTAFPVAARILQEKGVATTPLGAVGIAAAAVVTILMFLLVGVARGVAADAPGSVHVKRIIGTVIFLAVMALIVRPLLVKFFTDRRLGTSLHGTYFVATVIFVLASAYAADRIGINAIVGGFVAGAVVPRHAVLMAGMKAKLSDITIAVLLPIFLALSGLNTDFTKLGWSWMPGLILFIVVAIVAKWGGGIVSGRLGGLSMADSNVLGILMNCRGLLVLVVALIALQGNVITPQMQVGAVLMALVTTAMTGPLVDKYLPKQAPLGGLPLADDSSAAKAIANHEDANRADHE